MTITEEAGAAFDALDLPVRDSMRDMLRQYYTLGYVTGAAKAHEQNNATLRDISARLAACGPAGAP